MPQAQTCRLFHQISRHRAVWHQHLLHNLAVGRLPRPFFLPRSLPGCSLDELISVIGRWQARWPGIVPMRLSCKIVNLGVLEGRTVQERHHLPGGRWLLLVCQDGSTWCLDLVRGSAPRLLTPSPYNYSSPRDAKIWAATEFDFVTHQQENPACYCFHSFTFSIVTQRWMNDPGYQLGEPAHINIWRVEAVSVDDVTFPHGCSPNGTSRLDLAAEETKALVAVEHLSSFGEMRFLNSDLTDRSKSKNGAISLLGRHIAYPLFHQNIEFPCVVIVDWQKARGVTDWRNLERWCIPKCYVNVSSAVLRSSSKQSILTLSSSQSSFFHTSKYWSGPAT